MKKLFKIDVINRQYLFLVRPVRIRKLIMQVFKQEAKYTPRGQVNICFVDDRCIKNLNSRFLGKSCATDVLAFENSGFKENIQADIVVSTQSAFRNSRVFKTTPEYEIQLYVVHGILHILG